MVVKKLSKKHLNAPHIIIDAGPGSGKTTTMIAGLNILKGNPPEWIDQATDEQKVIWEAMQGDYSTIAFQAFGNAIAKEIETKIPHGVKASTFHSHGNAMLRNNGYKLKPHADNDMFILKSILGYGKDESVSREHFQLSRSIKKLVSLLKNNLLEPTTTIVGKLCDENGIEGETDQLTRYSKAVMDQMKTVEPGKFAYMSFDDMLWLPIVLNLDFEDSQYDLLICDESQDLNPIQHTIVGMSGSRLICVGDPRQAIYGFRGADSMSMKTLEDKLKATKRGVQILTLQTSFRLPISGVENVKKFAPNLRPSPTAEQGEIKYITRSQFSPQPGDLVLSRINSNIFTLGFQLLQERVPVRIEGRDFSKQILSVIKLCGLDESIETVYATIGDYDQRESARIKKKQFHGTALDNHEEKMKCLFALIDGCRSVREMINVVEELFSNSLKREDVVLLSTIHRAKGLEADHVFILNPNLIPHPMAKRENEIEQEHNLKFVAETRHKKSLSYIIPDSDEDDCEIECAEEVVEQ